MEHGADVRAVVLDGCYANVKSVRILGEKLDFDDFEPSFRHPITCNKVSIIFNPCHMLKLSRNLLGDHGILIDPEGKTIKWSTSGQQIALFSFGFEKQSNERETCSPDFF